MDNERLNQYTCQTCGQSIITVDRVPGVTPMFIRCRATVGCSGRAHSAFYRVESDQTPTFEWRKPTPAEYEALDAATREEHVDRGGLLIYPLSATGG